MSNRGDLPRFGATSVQNGRGDLEDVFSAFSLRLNERSIDRVDHGASAARGAQLAKRNAQLEEDIEEDGSPTETLSWFAVYDGHGGKEVAEFAQEHLHLHFLTALAESEAASSSRPASEDLPLDHTSVDDAVNSSSCAVTAAAAAASGGCSGVGTATNTAAFAAGCSLGRGFDSAAAAAAADDGNLAAAASDCGGSPFARHSLTGSSPDAAPSTPPQAPTSRAGSGGTPPPPALPAERPGLAIGRALRQAFLQTDRALMGTEVGEVVGSTALVAVVGSGEVHLAHCGDSRAVLCRKGAAITLTCDHKPNRQDEAARVRASGGRVVFKGGSHRVMGLLAMSRALGDHFLRPYVIPEPEVTSFRRSGDDELLLLATDGLWDAFTPQEAVNLALRSAHRARERGASRTAACRIASSVLTRAAAQRGSRDNITVVLIDLRQGPDAPSLAAVLASQCSEEVALTPRRPAERTASAGRSGNGGSAVSADGAGGALTSSSSGAGNSAGRNVLVFRHSHDDRCDSTWPALGRSSRNAAGGSSSGGGSSGSGAAACGAGAATGGGCVFRASSVPVCTGAQMSLRRASTVTPVGIALPPCHESCMPPANCDCGTGGASGAGCGGWKSGGFGGGGSVGVAAAGGSGQLPGLSPEAPRTPGVQRSHSFSSVELGHVLRRTMIDAGDGPLLPPVSRGQQGLLSWQPRAERGGGSSAKQQH